MTTGVSHPLPHWRPCGASVCDLAVPSGWCRCLHHDSCSMSHAVPAGWWRVVRRCVLRRGGCGPAELQRLAAAPDDFPAGVVSLVQPTGSSRRRGVFGFMMVEGVMAGHCGSGVQHCEHGWPINATASVDALWGVRMCMLGPVLGRCVHRDGSATLHLHSASCCAVLSFLSLWHCLRVGKMGLRDLCCNSSLVHIDAACIEKEQWSHNSPRPLHGTPWHATLRQGLGGFALLQSLCNNLHLQNTISTTDRQTGRYNIYDLPTTLVALPPLRWLPCKLTHVGFIGTQS